MFLLNLSSVSNVIAQTDDDEPEPMVKLYDISDLIRVSDHGAFQADRWPGTGMLAPSEPSNSTTVGGMGGGMGGMGGGGMFRVPDSTDSTILPQMGGMGGMGGGMGGMGGLSAYPNTITAKAARTSELMNTIYAMVLPDSWSDTAGGYANLQIFNERLVVWQTEQGHKDLGELLQLLRSEGARNSNQVVSIQWAAIRVKNSEAMAIQNLGENTSGNAAGNSAEEFLAARMVQSGVIQCLNGQLCHNSSGNHRAMIVGGVPVVGGQAAAFQPNIVKPLLGWLVEVEPTIDGSDKKIATIRVAASHTSSSPPQMPIAVVSDVVVDRQEISGLQVAGTVRAMEKNWTLVGGMSSDEEDSLDKLYFFIRWQ